MDKKEKKWIKIAGLQDKRQTTAVMCGELHDVTQRYLFLTTGSLLIVVITSPTRRPCYST